MRRAPCKFPGGFELYVKDVKLCNVVRPKEYRSTTWSLASLDLIYCLISCRLSISLRR